MLIKSAVFLLSFVFVSSFNCFDTCKNDGKCFELFEICSSRYFVDLWVLQCMQQHQGDNQAVSSFLSCQAASPDLVKCLPSAKDDFLLVSYASIVVNNSCGFFCNKYSDGEVCSDSCKDCTKGIDYSHWNNTISSYGKAVTDCFSQDYKCQNFEVRLGFLLSFIVLIFCIIL